MGGRLRFTSARTSLLLRASRTGIAQGNLQSKVTVSHCIMELSNSERFKIHTEVQKRLSLLCTVAFG